MIYRTILLPAFLIACTVLYLHTTALAKHLYFTYWWFDMVIHFLTGLCISMIVVYGVRRASPLQVTSTLASATIALPVVLIFAVGWEIFEVVNTLVYARGYYYVLDTTIDILMGILGGLFGVLYISIFLKKLWQTQA